MQDINEFMLKVCNLIEDRRKHFFTKNNFPRNQYAGEIIGIQRDNFFHYGIYLGDNQVIHYTSLNSDTSDEDNEIMITDLDVFFRQQTELYVVEVNKRPSEFEVLRSKIINVLSSVNLPTESIFKIYSPEETIQRAKTRLGEKEYSLKTNNCEHFAYWAKMGLQISDQVKNVTISVVGTLIHLLDEILNADSNSKTKEPLISKKEESIQEVKTLLSLQDSAKQNYPQLEKVIQKTIHEEKLNFVGGIYIIELVTEIAFENKVKLYFENVNTGDIIEKILSIPMKKLADYFTESAIEELKQKQKIEFEINPD